MFFWRLIFAVTLGLSLTLAGGARGVLVAKSLGSTTLTICDEHGARQITLDAKGEEIPRSHAPCPDCTLALALEPGAILSPVPRPEGGRAPWTGITALVLPALWVGHAQARGPPILL